MENFKGKVSVIIPAYNEEAHIARSIEETEKVFKEVGCDYEIIVVDDGSMDKTHQGALEASRNFNNVQVVRNSSNNGKGSALKHGFNYTSGDLVAFLDADMDLHPQQIQTLFNYMESNNADVVIGSKRHPESELEYPWHRKLISNVYYGITKTLFSLPVKDTQTGIKLFKHKVLDDIFPRVLVKRYAFDLELLVNAHHRKYKISEAPIKLDFQRKFGRIRLKDIYHTAMDTLAIFYRLHILRYYDQVKKD